MGNCVSGPSKVQYTNRNIWFVLCIFDEGKPLKRRLLNPYMVDDMDYSCHRDSNNNLWTKLQKLRKDALYAVSVDDNNCPILLPFLSVSVFLLIRHYQRVWFTLVVHGWLISQSCSTDIKFQYEKKCWRFQTLRFEKTGAWVQGGRQKIIMELGKDIAPDQWINNYKMRTIGWLLMILLIKVYL